MGNINAGLSEFTLNGPTSNFIGSPVTFVSWCVPLPIELFAFNAEIQDNRWVKLDWKTSSENHNDYFIIERSKELENWEFLVQIDGAGSTSQIQSYTAQDPAPYENQTYYRLKQVDFNGEEHIFGIRNVTCELEDGNQKRMIFPNPTKGQIEVYGTSYNLDQLELFNAMGQRQEFKVLSYGSQSATIDISQLTNGLYLMRCGGAIYRIIKD